MRKAIRVKTISQKTLMDASKRYTENTVTIYDGAMGLFATEEQKQKERESIESIAQISRGK